MSRCDPIEFDYAKALEEHQAEQVPIDVSDMGECPDCDHELVKDDDASAGERCTGCGICQGCYQRPCECIA